MTNDKKTSEDWIESVKKQKEDRSRKACATVIGITVVLIALFWIVGNNVINWTYVIITAALILAYICIMGHKEIHTEKRMIATMIFMSVVLNMTIYHVQIKSGLQGAVGVVDSLYNSLILIMGEYNEITTENTVLIWAHNFGRFFALITLYGSLIVIFLRKHIRYIMIKKFYKDIVIIADKPDGFVLDLAYELCSSSEKEKGHKVVLGYVDKSSIQNIDFDDGVPKVYVDIQNTENVSKILEICNIEHAKQVYLLCDDVETNVKIAKAIYSIINNKKSQGQNKIELNSNSQNKENKTIIYEKTEFYKDVQNALEENDLEHLKTKENKNIIQILLPELDAVIFTLLNARKPKITSGKNDDKQEDVKEGETKKLKCFIQYKEDEERNYYSFDEAFLNQEDNFDSYFINPYDIGLRQMIVKSKVHKNITFFPDDSTQDTYNVCVSGSINLAYRTCVEIARNNVYSTKAMKIYYVDDRDDIGDMEKKIKNFNTKFSEQMVEVKHITFEELKKTFSRSFIHQFYLCDVYEPRIRTYIQKIFQKGFGRKVYEYIVVTKGSDTEYGILKNYLYELFNHEVEKKSEGQQEQTENDNSIKPILYLSRISDLLVSYSKFYENHGKGAKEIREEYLKSLEKNHQSKDFSKLPEIFKDSDILSLIHKRRMTDVLDSRYKHIESSLNETNFKKWYFDICSDILFLSSTEHSRWYNERTLQGFSYDETVDNKFTNIKSNLRVYEDLIDNQKIIHHKYFLQMLQDKLICNELYEDESGLIITMDYKVKPNEENKGKDGDKNVSSKTN